MRWSVSPVTGSSTTIGSGRSIVSYARTMCGWANSASSRPSRSSLRQARSFETQSGRSSFTAQREWRSSLQTS